MRYKRKKMHTKNQLWWWNDQAYRLKSHIRNFYTVKAMVLPVVMDRCESWTIKAECRRNESPLDCKESKPVNPKGNQPWIFTGRTDAEVPIL